jgi:predicted DsbA family dithiol-disulfide isomerase
MSSDRLAIVAYSDYVCPWCYIALERVDRLQGEFPIDVEWRPFELHPETPRDGARLVGRFESRTRATAYTQNIIGLANASAITLRMPAVIANSHLALEAAEFTREYGGFDAYHRALFAAYFEHGRDLGDPEALCGIARAEGLDDQGLRQALADGHYAELVDRITVAAREDEVLSTPTFVFSGGFRLTGAQDYAVFESITSRLLAKQARDSI